MNENEIVLRVRGASKVRALCELLHSIQESCVQNSLRQTKSEPVSIDLQSGLTLKCSFISAFSVAPIEPVTINSMGQVVNAEILIRYVEVME